MAAAWVHCNFCMTQDFRELFMTSCGKVVCAKCKPKLSSVNCENCKGPCTKTVQINHQAPKEVLRLFEDPSGTLKTALKGVDFQNNQRRRLLAFHRHNYNKEHQKLEETMQRKDEMYAKLRSLDLQKEDLDRKVMEAEVRNRRLKEALVQQQQQQLQGAGTSKSNAFQVNCQTKDALSSSFNGFGAIGDPAMMSTPFKAMPRANVITPMFNSPIPGRDMSATSRGFLEMKTPAAWNAHKKPHGGGSHQDFTDRHRPRPGQSNIFARQHHGLYDGWQPSRRSPFDNQRPRSSGAGSRPVEVDRGSICKFFSPPC